MHTGGWCTLSSFSKTLAPGYRVAWIEAPAPLVAKFELAKQAADLAPARSISGSCTKRAGAACSNGSCPCCAGTYQAKRDVMVEALREEFGDKVSWPDPRGGFFLWATLPDQIDADAMIDRSVEHGVIYVAGAAFFVNDQGHNIIRLAFSAPSHEKIREGVKRLAAAVDAEMADALRAVK